MNIRLKLTLWYTALLFCMLIIFGVVIYIGLSRSLLVAIDNHLQREAGLAIGNLKFELEEHEEDDDHEDDAPEDGEHEKMVGHWEVELKFKPEEGLLWRILDTQGQPLLDPGYFDEATFDLPAGLNQVSFSYGTLADDTPIRLYTAPFILEGQGRGIIQVAESYAQVQEVQQQLIFLLTVSGPFILLAASGGGWFLATNALAPIDRITRTADKIGATGLHQRLNFNLPDDEVGRLAQTFDKMLARLEAAFNRQKRFIADASHEMRTPLTILKGDVEVALIRPRTVTEYQETLHMVNETTDRLTALVEELLQIARADNQQYDIQRQPTDLTALLSKRIKQLQPQAHQKQITLTLDAPPTITLDADPAKLTQLFLNLIDNALKYSEPHDTVTVTVTPEATQVLICVSDTGPGIPTEHLPHLFERFYRVDKARSRQMSQVNGRSGSGLGLSIAQQIAVSHGGDIAVNSVVGQGTTFVIRLPQNHQS